MTYCWKCPICGHTEETRGRGEYKVAPLCDHDGSADESNPATYMIRDYRAEGAQVDAFSLRQDVRGTRAHRADPVPPEEAHRINQERLSR